MKYAQIREFDIANGPGIRTSLFVSGCTHNCKGCFNALYQDFNYGNIFTNNETKLLIKYLSNDNVSGLSLLGGEPMQNARDLYEPLKEIRNFIDKENLKLDNKKTIWIYSGYTFEEILKNKNMLKILKLCDVLIDGKFIEEKLNLRLQFRGSENQRIIDIKKTLEENQVIIIKEFR